MVPFSRVFLALSIPNLPIRSFPPTFLSFAFQASTTWLLSPLPLTDIPRTRYLIPSLRSQPLPLFQSSDCSSTGKSWDSRCGHDNGCFFCLVNLLPRHVNAIYDLTLGRDWFNYCTTSVPDAQILLSDDMRLFFSSSPFPAVRPHRTCEFLLL